MESRFGFMLLILCHVGLSSESNELPRMSTTAIDNFFLTLNHQGSKYTMKNDSWHQKNNLEKARLKRSLENEIALETTSSLEYSVLDNESYWDTQNASATARSNGISTMKSAAVKEISELSTADDEVASSTLSTPGEVTYGISTTTDETLISLRETEGVTTTPMVFEYLSSVFGILATETTTLPEEGENDESNWSLFEEYQVKSTTNKLPESTSSKKIIIKPTLIENLSTSESPLTETTQSSVESSSIDYINFEKLKEDIEKMEHGNLTLVKSEIRRTGKTFHASKGILALSSLQPSIVEVGYQGAGVLHLATAVVNGNIILAYSTFEKQTVIDVINDKLEIRTLIKFDGNGPCCFMETDGYLIVACTARSSLNKYKQEVRILELNIEKNLVTSIQNLTDVHKVGGLDSWLQYDKSMIFVTESEKIDPYEKLPTYETKSWLYEWNGKQFKAFQQFPGFSPRTPHHFVIQNDHFIALPSFVNNAGDHNLNVDIYKFDESMKIFVHFQSLPSFGAVHVTSFTLGTRHSPLYFLVVANNCKDEGEFCEEETNSTIYKYNPATNFLHFQCIKLSSATRWAVVQVEDQAVLIVLNIQRGLTFYQNDGWEFIQVQPAMPHELSQPGLTDITNFWYEGDAVLVVGSTASEGRNTLSLYQMKFVRQEPLEEAKRIIGRWCRQALTTLNGKTEEMKRNMINLPLKNRPISIDRITAKNFKIESLSLVPVVDQRVVKRLESLVSSLDASLGDANQRMDEIESKVMNSISLNETINWPDNLKFTSVLILAAKAEELETQFIDGYEVPSIDDLIPIDDESIQLDLQRKTFSQIKVQDITLKNLNGYPLTSYATTNGDYSFKGHILFGGLRTPGINLGGLIDGVNVTDRLLFLRSRDQKFSGNLQCNRLVAVRLETDYINNVNVNLLMKDTAVNSSSVVLKGSLTILGDLIYPKDLRVKTLSGKNLQKLQESALLLKSEEIQVITGKYSLSEAKVEKLYIRDSLNGFRFPESVYANLPENVYHVPKAYFSGLSAAEVTVDKELNGIMVNEGKLDVLTTSGDQLVNGNKIFHHIHLEDNKRLSLRYLISLEHQNTASRNSAKQIFKNIKNESYEMFNMKEQLKGSVSLLQSYYILKAYVIDLAAVKPVLSINQLDGNLAYDLKAYKDVYQSLENLYEYLQVMKRFIEQEVNKEIVNLIHNDFSRVDKSNVAKVSELSSVPLELQIKLENFNNIIEAVVASIDKKIFELKRKVENLRKLIFKAEKQFNVDHSMFEFDDKFSTSGSKIAGTISGYNFDELLENKLSEGDNSNITLSAIMEADRLIFLGNLITPSLNNVNVERLLERVIPISSQEVNLNLIFNNEVVIQGDLKAPIVNGVESKSLATLAGTNVFEKSLKFKGIRVEDDVEVKGKVNNFYLKNEASQIALISKSQNFKEEITFLNLKTEWVKTDEVLLHGRPLEDFVLRSDKHPFISGSKQFSNVTILNATVNIEDLRTDILDGVNISKSIENSRVAYDDVTISEPTMMSKLTVKGNVEVQGDIQAFGQSERIYLKKLQKQVAYLDEENFFPGDFVFGGKIYVKDLIFRDTFDGLSAQDFDFGFVMKKENQTIEGKNLFKNLKVKNLVVNNNILQGVNLSDLVSKAAKIDEDNFFPGKVFFGKLQSKIPIKVNGLVHGWNLTHDAVLKSKSATIIAPKSFQQPVTVLGDLDVKGFINGFDLGKKCNDIIGTITIDGSVHFRKNLHSGRIYSGEFSIPDSEIRYWMTDKKATLPSDIVFDRLRTRHFNVKKELNNEPIKTFLRDPINCEDVVEGKWIFGNLTCSEISTSHLKVNYLNMEDSNILERILVNGTDQHLDSDLKVSDVQIINSLMMFGKLNGHKITNFCRLNLSCVITSPKKFMSHFKVLQNWDLHVGSFINKLKIEDIKSLDEMPPVRVIIEDTLQAPEIYVEGYVNGIRLDANTIMSLSANQTMRGALLITNRGGVALNAKKVRILNDLYSGINVSTVQTYSMKMRRASGDDDPHEEQELIDDFHKLGRRSFEIGEVLRDQVVTFAGWKVVQEFKDLVRVTPLLDSVDANKNRFNTIVLISHNEVKLMTHVPISNIYRDADVTVSVNCTTDAKGFYNEMDLFFATSSNCPNDFNLTGVSKIKPEGINMEEKVYSFVWKVTPKGVKMYAAVATTEASQVLIFKISGRNCILFVSARALRLNILCQDNAEFILQQSMQADHAIKVLHMTYVSTDGAEESLLIIGNSDYAISDQKLSTVKIMKYNNFNNHFIPLQEIHLERLIELTSGKFGQDLYLATVHQPFYDSTVGEIQIYRVSENSSRNEPSNKNIEFRWEETILVDTPIQATFMETPSNGLLLLVLTKNGHVERYQKHGFEKFQLDGVMHLPGKNHLVTWNWHQDEIYNLAVSGTTCEGPVGRYSKVRSRSTIFKPVFKGLNGEDFL